MFIPHSKPWISNTDKESIHETLFSKEIAYGSLVKDFEKKIKEFTGTQKAIAHCSGKDALISAIKLLGIDAGDEIILPNYVCCSVYEAIIICGAKPILCDVNQLGLITNSDVERVITNRTKGIIGVHIYGNKCDINSLKKFGIPVIEDACQSFGLSLEKNITAGSLGDLGILSFHATKCITTGEGGCLLINKSNIKSRQEITEGKTPKIHISPMTNIQASLGLSQISRYKKMKERRKILHDIYNDYANRKGFETRVDKTSDFCFRFCLDVKDGFKQIQQKFLNRGIQARRGVDELLDRKYEIGNSSFKNSELIFHSNLSLPFYPALNDNEVEFIMEELLKI